MDLRNCVKCGRVFSYNGNDICTRCAGDDVDDFKKVKEYLYENPGANIVEVSEETEVPEKKILRYLRENRIEIREADNFLLDCQRCGKPIQSGRFCDKCTHDMKREFTAAVKPKKEEPESKDPGKDSSKMYVSEIRKNRK